MSKNATYIEIDATPLLYSDGNMEIEVFLGPVSEPSYTEKVHLNDLIEKELESFLSPKTNKIADYHTDDAKALIRSLKRAVKYCEKRVEKLS